MTTETDIEKLVEQKVQEEVEQRLKQRQTKQTRRSFLAKAAGVAGVGALGIYGGQRAAADPPQADGTVYFDQIGDSNYPVQDLYVQNQVNYNETEYFEQLSAGGVKLDSPSSSISQNASLQMYAQEDVADGATVGLTPFINFEDTALYLINVGRSAAFLNTSGGAGSVDIHSNPEGDFSTTQGNSGTHNVFSDGSEYKIENLTGGQVTYSIFRLQ